MPYDPFAPQPLIAPPPPVPVQQDQVMPNPIPVDLAANNALAPVAAPTVTTTAAPGGMQGPHPMSFVDKDGRIANMQAFMQALSAWRGERPRFDFDPASDLSRQEQRADFRETRSDWRDQRPSWRDFRMGNTGVVPPTSTPPVPSTPSVDAPIMTPGGGGGGAPLQAPLQNMMGGGANIPSWRAPRLRGF